jgi:hypothetical protein
VGIGDDEGGVGLEGGAESLTNWASSEGAVEGKVGRGDLGDGEAGFCVVVVGAEFPIGGGGVIGPVDEDGAVADAECEFQGIHQAAAGGGFDFEAVHDDFEGLGGAAARREGVIEEEDFSVEADAGEALAAKPVEFATDIGFGVGSNGGEEQEAGAGGAGEDFFRDVLGG